MFMAYNKRAGRSTREMANQRHQSALRSVIIGMVVLITISLFILKANVFGIGGIGIVVLLIFMSVFRNLIEGQVDRKIKLEKRAIRGAKAEEKIGELLAKLPEDYSVLNDVESPYGNIDHIVIGKNSGIFLIETKAHGGKVETNGVTILLNGKIPEKDFIAQALQNSYWLRDKISEITGSKPWINPVVVFTNAFVSPTKPIKGVNIINKKYLLNMLCKNHSPNAVLAQVWENRKSIESKLL
jgi:hypothetical protein